MKDRQFPKKRSGEEIDRTKLEEPVSTDEDWNDFNRGIRLFNEGKFWHAHEAWEQVWRKHREDSRLFIQGLIQMAAAFHLMIEKRRYSGAMSNFDKALMRLRLFEPTFLDLPVSNYIKVIELAKDEIRRLEKSVATEIDQTVIPVMAFLRKQQMG